LFNGGCHLMVTFHTGSSIKSTQIVCALKTQLMCVINVRSI